MDFIMRDCAKYRRTTVSAKIKTYICFWLLCLGCFFALDANAKGIVIERVGVNHDNGRYTLDADITYELSDVAREALHKGVGLTFKLAVAVMRPRQVLWDQAIIKERRSYYLSYQALTGQYRLNFDDSPLIQSFPTLDSALAEIGTLRDVPVPLFGRGLRENKEYVELRAWLDVESLPVPMRIRAYIFPEWRHNSGWYRWQPNL